MSDYDAKMTSSNAGADNSIYKRHDDAILIAPKSVSEFPLAERVSRLDFLGNKLTTSENSQIGHVITRTGMITLFNDPLSFFAIPRRDTRTLMLNGIACLNHDKQILQWRVIDIVTDDDSDDEFSSSGIDDSHDIREEVVPEEGRRRFEGDSPVRTHEDIKDGGAWMRREIETLLEDLAGNLSF
jgi:hypothetical protein